MQFPMPEPEQALPKEEAQDGLPMTVGIGMLKSYERMGMVNVACTEGCSCRPRKFDLHHEEQASTCRNCFAHCSLLSTTSIVLPDLATSIMPTCTYHAACHSPLRASLHSGKAAQQDCSRIYGRHLCELLHLPVLPRDALNTSNGLNSNLVSAEVSGILPLYGGGAGPRV